MAMDYVDIDCVPCDEECTPAGHDPVKERRECRAYIGQLKRMFPEWEEKGITFRIKSNPHDFGSYLSVQVRFNDADEDATDYAFQVEGGLPATWDDIARAEVNPPFADIDKDIREGMSSTYKGNTLVIPGNDQ